jgi:hypothetical protein
MIWRQILICAAVVVPVVGLFYVAVVRQFRDSRPPRVKPVREPGEGDPMWHARVRWHRFSSRHRRGVRS